MKQVELANKDLNSQDLGLIHYESALELQQRLVREQKELVLVCEHPAVITVGRGKDSFSDILSSSLPIVEVERGGRATLHLPGQIVMYPVVNLKARGLDQVQWLRILEKTVITCLKDFRIESTVIEGKTGVWVDGKRKIASIGVAVKNDMAYHGLALNICCDLQLFKSLKPCGFNSDVMTSMKNEIPNQYEKVWQLTDKGLLDRVRLRLSEDLEEELMVHG